MRMILAMIVVGCICLLPMILFGCEENSQQTKPTPEPILEPQRLEYQNGYVYMVHDDKLNVTCWITTRYENVAISCLPNREELKAKKEDVK